MRGSRRALLRSAASLVAALGARMLAGCEGRLGRGAAGATTGPTATSGASVAPRAAIRGTIIGPGRYTEDGRPRFVLSLVDLDADRPAPRTIPLRFFAHGVTPHPLVPTRAVLFEKHGKGACEVDLARGEVTRPIETAPSHEFYGHGAYSPDGKIMFCTEVVKTDGKRGVIVVRDAETLTALGEIPSHGTSPHDCRLIEEGKVLVVTNGGTPHGDDRSRPSVTFVDVATHALLERHEPTSARVNAGHLALSRGRTFALVSAPRDGLEGEGRGALSLRGAEGPLRTLVEPADVTARMRGETLSAAIHEGSGVVGVTNPEADLVTFWDLASGALRKAVTIEKARGIALTLCEKAFVVTGGGESGGRLHAFDAASLEPLPKIALEPTFLTGSHAICHRL